MTQRHVLRQTNKIVQGNCMRNCWMRPRRGNCTTRGPDTPTTRRQRASCRANPQLRPARRPPICHNTPAITTTRQNSHVIRLREHSTTSRNVAIPTITIQSLKQLQGNYVRNWWQQEQGPKQRSSDGIHSATHSCQNSLRTSSTGQADTAALPEPHSSTRYSLGRRYAEGPTWRSAPRRIPSTQCK